MRQIVDGDLIVRAPLALLSDVHDDSVSEEALKWDLIDALMSLREVHWRVDVRSAMLGGREAVGGRCRREDG